MPTPPQAENATFVDFILNQWAWMSAVGLMVFNVGKTAKRVEALEKHVEEMKDVKADIASMKSDLSWLRHYTEKHHEL